MINAVQKIQQSSSSTNKQDKRKLISKSEACFQKVQGCLSTKDEKNISQERFEKNYESWFGQLIESKNIDENLFNKLLPFVPTKSNSVSKSYRPKWQGELPNPSSDSKDPVFVVNIPAIAPPIKGTQIDADELSKKITLIRDEAFGSKNKESHEVIQKRMAIVLGFNRCKSLDREINQKYKEFFQTTPKVNDVALSVFGFFWKPTWKERYNYGNFKHLNCKETYQLLKILRPEAAELLLTLFEKRNSLFNEIQIPYQIIRETIKNSVETESYVKIFRKVDAPLYISCYDWDTIRLRVDGLGAFTHYSNLITEFWSEKKVYPCLLSTGYQASEEMSECVRLSIKMDKRVCSEAIFPHFKNGLYYSEPSISFFLPRQLELTDFSFVKDGGDMESRRLISNGLQKNKRGVKVFNESRFLFSNRGSLVTETYRLSNQKADGIKKLNKKNIGQKAVLKALRGIKQTHFDQHWAYNIYKGLDFKEPGRFSIQGPLHNLVNIFDPSQLVFDFSPKVYGGNYSQKHFVEFMTFYEEIVQAILDASKLSGEERKDYLFDVVENHYKKRSDQNRHDGFINFFQTKVDQFLDCYNKFLVANLCMEKINKCIACAIDTGQIIYEELNEILES